MQAGRQAVSAVTETDTCMHVQNGSVQGLYRTVYGGCDRSVVSGHSCTGKAVQTAADQQQCSHTTGVATPLCSAAYCKYAGSAVCCCKCIMGRAVLLHVLTPDSAAADRRT